MKQNQDSLRYSSRLLARLALLAALLVFVAIVAGGVVSASGSGGACPDWPACLGQFTPPAGRSALLDYLHRAAVALAAPLAMAAAFVALDNRKLERWLRALPLAAALLTGLQALLGAYLGQAKSPALSTLHLGLSLAVLGLLAGTATVAFWPRAYRQVRISSPFALAALFALLMYTLVLLSGTALAGSPDAICTGWPLCAENPWQTPAAWGPWAHRLLVGTAGLVLAWLLWRAWRTQRSQPAVLTAGTAAFVLFVSQALLGARLSVDAPLYLLVLHQATAAAVWAALVVASVAAFYSGEAVEAVSPLSFRAALAPRRWLDFLLLTKPIVVALLLVTTYAGMVIGARAWPAWQVTLWTLLGGFMAAGGSGAINQYIDRYDDTKMQRTQKRPIPSGRLTPAEGLAFGVALALGSFYLLVAFVNILAALLSLAGIFYYVLLYSLILKKTTVQNIVIGGGAGAIPPLVGWAAATGALNIPSLFLFAVIFMWTPPHFWALALVRRKDYARAGVPMLPVVRGEQETRWQIFLYTVELVGLTLLLPLFGLGSSIYLVGAVMLGGWLLLAAWRVWKQGGNKLAWKMYRYSSMYLAFIFIVLMIDRLVI